MNYKPDYDTEINERRKIVRINTMHVDKVDWDNYPFDDPEHTQCMGTSDERKAEHIARLKQMLKDCEDHIGHVRAGTSEYTYPVASVGMASAWPYWRPRPTVIVSTHMGADWHDWTSLHTVKVLEEVPA